MNTIKEKEKSCTTKKKLIKHNTKKTKQKGRKKVKVSRLNPNFFLPVFFVTLNTKEKKKRNKVDDKTNKKKKHTLNTH